ncbi:hypothetical protein EVAR_90741_1 [Eumeta japonica]|uniref:Mariner Mos1 transposase n=1 Tax=Eumeta variegata TaxID=151549 RepID=A0A4C1ZUW2_EUMVA|nr:hypothetical protein EVAR_90741_1 [Eumeta japonica]
MDEKGEAAEEIKVQKSASKFMATILRYEGVLLIDYLPKGTTVNNITRIYWLRTRGSCTEAMWEVIARSAVSRQCICPHGAGFEAGHGHRASEIDHPPYSSDLAPATISFSNLKRSYVVVDLLMTIK